MPSRQYKLQQAYREEGRCACGNKVYEGSVSSCLDCLLYAREYMRKRRGSQPRRKNAGGRPPLTREVMGVTK